MNINRLFDIVKREEKRRGETLTYAEVGDGQFNVKFDIMKDNKNILWVYPWDGEGLAGASPYYRKVEGGIMIGLEFNNDLPKNFFVNEEFIPLAEEELEEL